MNATLTMMGTRVAVLTAIFCGHVAWALAQSSDDLASLLEKAEQGHVRAQELLVEAFAGNCRTGNDLCAALLKDPNQAARWIRELARVDRVDTDRRTKGIYQSRLAWISYFSAGPEYSETNSHCADAIRYGKSAIGNGDRCTADLFRLMYALGHCVPRDGLEHQMWSALSSGCPRP